MTPVAKYTRFVIFGKSLLWLLAIGIVALVIWIASNNNSDNGGRMVFTNTPKMEELQNIMVKPRYQGVDVRDNPYTIEAESGIQKDKDSVALTKITADTTSQGGDWVALKSGAGVINMSTKQMELTDGVELFYEGGYQFRTDHAHVDIAKGTAQGDSHIEGQGTSGTIEADSFSILEHGSIINFNGSVRMLLY